MTENKTIQDDILADITVHEEEKAAFQDRKEMFSSIAPFIVGGATLLFLVLIFMARRKKRLTLWEVERNSLQNAVVPKQEMSLPATILYMKSMTSNGNILSASLFDLVRKGYVKRKSENEFEEVSQDTDHFHEQLLINWLFHKIGKNGKFTISNLKKYTKNKSNQLTYHSDLTQWLGAIRGEISQHQLTEKKAGLRWTVVIISLLLIPFSILFGTHHLPIWTVLSIFLSIGLLIFAIAYKPRTEKGERIKYHWEQFSKKYDSISEKEWSEWMSDEQMKAFIYAIGTNNTSMQKTTENFANSMSSSMQGFGTAPNDMIMLMLIASTVTTGFDSADQTISTTTGSGGSFTGGGTGVGGGGGGSGAF